MGNPISKSHSAMNDDLVTVKRYTGDTKNGKRHGHGIYMYSNGDIYDGEWRKSRRYGYGVYNYSDGTRLEGYFYRDEYIGKKPNEKIQKRMSKKKNTGDTVDFSMTEQTDLSADILDDNKDAVFKLKSEGSSRRRTESLRRNKWLRDKYKIKNKTETEVSPPLEADTKQGNRREEEPNNFKRSYSLGDKRRKNIDYDEAVERRRSQKLRESIRKKYNLKVGEKKDFN